MPRIFAETEEMALGEVILTGESHHYVARVLRMAAGDELVLFDGRGHEAQATVVRVGSQGVTLALGARRQLAQPTSAPLTLLQGLPRADRMDLIVQKATELGAARLIPVRTERTARGQLGRVERWRRIAREAARQCGRAEALEIRDVLSLEEALSALSPDAGDRVMPWEEAPEAPPFDRLISRAASTVTVLIGPEGGLAAGEARAAMDAAFKVATLGPRILRTETAAIAALAIAQARIGGLGTREGPGR